MAGKVGSPSAGCPPRLFNARWETTPVKCGDEVRMMADTEHIPADTPASFVIKQVSGGSAVGNVNSNTTASSVQGTWTSQKPSDHWSGPELKFTVTTAGKRADSQDPQLSFHRYPDIARTDFTQHMSTGVFGWRQAVKVELKDRVLIIHVPIKIRKWGKRPKRRKRESLAHYEARILRKPYRSPRDDLSNADKANLKHAIEAIFHQKMVLHRSACRRGDRCPDPVRRKCCKFEIKVKVHFYNMNDPRAPAMASEVNYWNDSGRADSANWYAADYPGSNWVFAHEVGHLMGFYDEYRGGACDRSAGTPWQCVTAFSISTLMNGGNSLQTYYFNHYAHWIGAGARTGEAWTVIPY